MPMRAWHVYDSDGHDAEERMSLLIVAETEADAIALWRANTGLEVDDAGDIEATVAEWRWSIPPPELPPRPGIWWPTTRTENGAAFRGYGFSQDDDARCDECDEHVDPADATDEDGFTVCRWCVSAREAT